MNFLEQIRLRNLPLYAFGWASFLAALICLLLVLRTDTQVLGINAYLKPMKFFLSSWIFAWTMGWYLFSLEEPLKVSQYSWMVIIILGFETLYIFIKANQGELSHFNISSPFNITMFALMGIAISILTLWTAYMGILFWTKPIPELPEHYIWAIRLGIIFFVFFAFEGGIMGGRLSHNIGGEMSGSGIPLLNWSTKIGDLRVAHFIGIHSLQILPILSFYVLKNTRLTWIIAFVYFILTLSLILQALNGRPFIKI